MDFMDYMGYLYANGKTLDENGEEVPIESEEDDDEDDEEEE